MLRKVFVYGTLKKGKRLHHCLTRAKKFICNHTIPGYTLYDIGYPLAVKNESGRMNGEIYLVDEDVWELIKGIEIGAGYFIKKINIKSKEEPKGDIYFFEYPKERVPKSAKCVGKEWN